MKTNIDRVKTDIEKISRFNATPGRGITRLAFSIEEKGARDYIKEEMERIGLEVREDGYSTIVGRREGVDAHAPVIMIGSHYDSVNHGGIFDGVAGVAAALEIARVLDENKVISPYPIEFVAMNDEEGVRFGKAVANSSAMAGLITENELDLLRDKNDISLREAMLSLGIEPNLEEAKREKGSIKAFFELHIEQGPILEQKGKKIGIVEAIVGYDMYKVRIVGCAGHAGTTPMDSRKDALLAASELALALENNAKEMGNPVVGTVGEFDLSPNASNVIPAEVKLSLDIRSTKVEDIDEMELRINQAAKEIAERRNVSLEIVKKLRALPVELSKELGELLENTAREKAYPTLRMNSGAGHDAMIMALIAPSAMIFVPSKEGLSHHPEEWTDWQDLEMGIDVLLGSILKII